jgi:hypothetical protein
VTTEAERGRVLARFLLAVLNRDESEIVATTTDDLRVWTALFDALDDRSDAMADVETTLRTFEIAGPYACAEWTLGFTHVGPLPLDGGVITATGLRLVIHGVTVAEFDGGRICAVRHYSDEAAVLQRLQGPAAKPTSP